MADVKPLAKRSVFGARCTHGLKPGLCNACPAERDTTTDAWRWVAAGSGRSRVVGGRVFVANPHGIILLDRGASYPAQTRLKPFWWWPSPRGIASNDDCGRELRDAVEDAFRRAGLRATCSPSGACGCAPRF